MKIEHIAIWTSDLNKLKLFYVKYFNGKAGNIYHNPKKNFHSYFIQFGGECRLELMHRPDIPKSLNDIRKEFGGLIHFAISVGGRDNVDKLTERLRADGYTIVGEPRVTGDGYYESVIFDPEGNRVEITE